MEKCNEKNSKAGVKKIGGIPVRNLWLLMLYASDLFRDENYAKVSVEDNPDEIPDLIAEILCSYVEKRLKKNLSHGFLVKCKITNRVRGRINILTTDRKMLIEKGQVSCNFKNYQFW
jgi:5-methylcytosine-specific restriction enzyme subunit McrC